MTTSRRHDRRTSLALLASIAVVLSAAGLTPIVPHVRAVDASPTPSTGTPSPAPSPTRTPDPTQTPRPDPSPDPAPTSTPDPSPTATPSPTLVPGRLVIGRSMCLTGSEPKRDTCTESHRRSLVGSIANTHR